MTEELDARTGAPKPVICVVYSSSDVTGAFVAIKRQAEIMKDEAGWHLAIPKHVHFADQDLAPFAKVIKLPLVELDGSSRALLRYFPALLVGSLQLRRHLRRHRCSRVQMNCFTLHHGAVLRLLGFRGTIVSWIRSDPSRLRKGGRLSLRLASWSSTWLIAISEYVRTLMPDRTHVRLIYDPVQDFPVIGASDEPALVLLGNYIPMKGQDLAIKAFHLIANRHPSAKLVFHGNRAGADRCEDYYRQLESLARDGPGSGQIMFGAFVEITEALSGKRASLMVSRWEPFGLACQDASAHGLPVIATRSGGPEEIVDDGQTGFLVDVGDVESLADRMDILLKDAAMARRMGAAGAALMKSRFPVARFKQELREIFRL